MTVMATKRQVIVDDEESDVEHEVSGCEENDSDINNQPINEKRKEQDSSDDSDSTKESDNESDTDGEADNEVDIDSDNGDNIKANPGWADSIAKILKTNKPKAKKTLVLSKAKKLSDVRKDKPQPASFEVECKDGEIKEEKVESTEIKIEENLEPLRKRKRELPNLRVKPNILEKDRERRLSKIATKGVVQLFNAVKTQQKDINTKLKEAGPLEVKRDKVLKNVDKRAFLDVLMGEKSENVDAVVQNKRKNDTNDIQKPTWNVLRDDFMMGAKLKDWDKELENEEEDEMEVDNNIESE